MQLKTILNRVQKHSSFVYETVRLVEHPRLAIEVEVRPRANARAKCSQCGSAAVRRRATTRCRPGASRSCRCGTFRWCFSTRCACQIAPNFSDRAKILITHKVYMRLSWIRVAGTVLRPLLPGHHAGRIAERGIRMS